MSRAIRLLKDNVEIEKIAALLGLYRWSEGCHDGINLLNVLPPPDAPPAHWDLVFDLRSLNLPLGDETFLVICRDHVLVEKCLKSFQKAGERLSGLGLKPRVFIPIFYPHFTK